MQQVETVLFLPKMQAIRSSVQRVSGHENTNKDGSEEAKTDIHNSFSHISATRIKYFLLPGYLHHAGLQSIVYTLALCTHEG